MKAKPYAVFTNKAHEIRWANSLVRLEIPREYHHLDIPWVLSYCAPDKAQPLQEGM